MLAALHLLHAGRGAGLADKAQRLTDDEFVRLAALFVGLGVTSIRLTGGEPLVHPDAADGWSRGWPRSSPRPEISLTTNGVTLGPLGRASWPTPGSTASTSRSTPSTASASPR